MSSHYSAALHRKWAPGLKRFVYFRHREHMRMRCGFRTFRLRDERGWGAPTTTLPVDCTGNGAVPAPMDGNDQKGDCGEAMIAHFFNIVTYGQGKPGFTEMNFDLNALIQQYTQVSGGDNGLDEDMVVNQIGKVGVAGNPLATIIDAIDFDVTNIPLLQYMIDQFYGCFMAWSVPDAFIQTFKHGAFYPSGMTPNPQNGHFTIHTDLIVPAQVPGWNINGYRLFTWGDFCYISDAFIASVQPQCFAVFSARQFNQATGYDSHGRHITEQAVKWTAGGGIAIPASVIASFPPPSGPVNPPPVPGPGPINPPPPAPTGTMWLASDVTSCVKTVAQNQKHVRPVIRTFAEDLLSAFNQLPTH